MNSFFIRTGTLSALAVCLISGLANADTVSNNAPLSGTSTTETTAATKTSAPLPFTISDYSMLQGPPVSDLKVNQAADDSSGALQPLSSRQYLGGRYLINSQMSVGPVLDFTYNFNSVPGAYDKGITWNNSFMTFRYNDLLKTKVGNDDLTGSLWLNYYAPTSHGSRLDNEMGEFAIWFNPTYQFHGSRWSLSAYDFVKYFANTRADDLTSGGALRRWTWYAGPQINYEVSDKLTLFVLYEANLRLYTNGLTDAAFNPDRSLTDLEPGVMWNVSKNITLFPYLNWFLNQSVDTTSIGLNASIKFL